MADPNNDGEKNTTPTPNEEEQQTETVDDEVKPKEQEPEPNQEPDVSARLDSIEKELATLKAMMDTLGYNDLAPSGNDNDVDDDDESIEDLFD